MIKLIKYFIVKYQAKKIWMILAKLLKDEEEPIRSDGTIFLQKGFTKFIPNPAFDFLKKNCLIVGYTETFRGYTVQMLLDEKVIEDKPAALETPATEKPAAESKKPRKKKEPNTEDKFIFSEVDYPYALSDSPANGKPAAKAKQSGKRRTALPAGETATAAAVPAHPGDEEPKEKISGQMSLQLPDSDNVPEWMQYYSDTETEN